jgi:hypothetical protein
MDEHGEWWPFRGRQTPGEEHNFTTIEDMEFYMKQTRRENRKLMTIEDLQNTAKECQSDGCQILLQAISKLCPDALRTTSLTNYWPLRDGCFTLLPARVPIQLFVTEDNYGKEHSLC